MADYSSAPPLSGAQKNIMGYDRAMMDAPNQDINVALQPTSAACGCTPGNCSCGPSCGCMCCWGNGPGGRTTNVQYNEKGILEQGLHHLISMTTSDPMGGDSWHDTHLKGVYASSDRAAGNVGEPGEAY